MLDCLTVGQNPSRERSTSLSLSFRQASVEVLSKAAPPVSPCFRLTLPAKRRDGGTVLYRLRQLLVTGVLLTGRLTVDTKIVTLRRSQRGGGVLRGGGTLFLTIIVHLGHVRQMGRPARHEFRSRVNYGVSFCSRSALAPCGVVQSSQGRQHAVFVRRGVSDRRAVPHTSPSTLTLFWPSGGRRTGDVSCSRFQGGSWRVQAHHLIHNLEVRHQLRARLSRRPKMFRKMSNSGGMTARTCNKRERRVCDTTSAFVPRRALHPFDCPCGVT